MKKIVPFILLLVLFAACKPSSTSSSNEAGDTLAMHYTSLLTIQQCDGYIYAEVKDPWDSTRVLHSYVLVDKDVEVPDNLPQGDLVRTPLANSVVYTSVHCSLIDQLGAFDAIKGVCDASFIYLDKVQAGIKAGSIRDLGESMNPNIEGVIDLSPDAILLSPFQNSGGYGKLGKLGILIIECADYMEVSPLARAEWMRFYGLLYGRLDAADSIFAGVETRYNELKALAAEADDRPTVFMDLKYGSQWYVPGGNSTVGIMLRDAGADYMYKERPENGSVPLDPEVVFDHCIDAEYWLIKYNQDTDKTYDEIAREYSNYSKLAAFRTKNTFGCNLSKVPYYEEVPFHPDILLKDYIKIFHPALLPDYTTRYFNLIK